MILPAENNDTDKAILIDDLGHELKQPLNGLRLYLDALKELDMPPGVASYVAKIDECAVEIHLMLTLLLDVVSYDMVPPKPVSPLVPVNLRDLPVRVRKANLLIAVIDDQLCMREMLRQLLGGWKHKVVTACCSSEARHKFRNYSGAPDIILCDYALHGGETGVMVIDSMRSEFERDIPAFILSATTRADHLEEIRASGLPLISKPFGAEDIKAILDQFIPASHVQ